MIITQLNGGLGNQLFQYAAGRALSIYHNTKLRLDISLYKKNKARQFDLQYFSINVHKIYSNKKLFRIPFYFNKVIKRKNGLKDYREPYFHFDPDFLKTTSNIYLKGYWQSEKYFIQYEQNIRTELTIKEIYIKHLHSKAQELKHQNSVAVHIRRGDYLHSENILFHGILDESYYHKAMQHFLNLYSDVKFYFFSDDSKWIKENIRVHKYEIVSGNISQKPIEDFYLMSQCRHNIIANSSFSWWAAWLNTHPNKRVIAPKKWFNNAPHNTQDLIPNSWMKI